MKKLVIVLLVFAVLAVQGVWWWVGASHKPPDLWKKAAVDRGEMALSVTASGGIEPVQEVPVGSQVSGRVEEVRVQLDQRVKQGEVLAVLDRELLESERKDKESQLQHARIALELLRAERENLDVRETRLKLNQDRERISVERSRASLDLASKNLQRYREMLQAEAVAQTELDIRKLEQENAQRDLKLKELDLKQLDLDLQQVAADRRTLASREQQAQLGVAQAEHALAKAHTNLGYASIVAPIDGIVLERSVQPGQTIAAQFQAPNLFKIITDLKKILARCFIDEADIGRIRIGQKVSFEVDAFQDEKFEGIVKAVHLKHEMRSNLVTYPVVIEADNPTSEGYPFGKLRPGLTAYVTFEVERKKDVLRLPAAALRFALPPGIKAEQEPAPAKSESVEAQEPQGMPAVVYVLNEKGSLKAVTVFVGENDGKYYELLSGPLKAGDELITGSALFDALKKKEE